MKNVVRFIGILLAGCVCLLSPAQAEERIALVVGNSAYAAVSPLENPTRDADLIGKALADLGFQVTMVTDASQLEMKRAIAQFGRALRGGGPDTVGLFYYAGHGVQSFGTNYLLPVDTELTDAADLDLVALEAAAVLRQMASARNRTNIVILDACRNNPFEAIPSLDDNGLAEMKAPTGTFLAYATAPGAVALDGITGNSPFTLALTQEMQAEDVPIEKLFKNVRVRVIEQTKGAQTPWDTSSLTRDFTFRAGKPLTPAQIAEQQLWQSVEQSRDPVQIMLFLRSHPDGAFEGAARALLADVMQQELAGQPVAKAPEPEPAPVPQGPSGAETEMFEAARASNQIADFEAYLQAYPTGVFAEIARIEVDSLRADAAKDPDPTPDQTAAAAPEPAPAAAPEAGLAVFFDQPLPQGAPEVKGKTISEIIAASPLFPPIEGLPDALWKDQACSNCHEWSREALCTQAQTYLTANAERSLAKQHPFGGSFKQNLRHWAEGGCN